MIILGSGLLADFANQIAENIEFAPIKAGFSENATNDLIENPRVLNPVAKLHLS